MRFGKKGTKGDFMGYVLVDRKTGHVKIKGLFGWGDCIVLKRLVLLLIIIVVPVVSAENKNITLEVQTGEQKVVWSNDTLEVHGNKTIMAYDGNMVSSYNAYINELKQNISKLQNELDNKNKLLAEYITYKKKNIELQQNISKLNNQITTLKAENELLKQHNEQYKDLITDLMNKQSNDTKSSYIESYQNAKKDMSNFKTAIIISIISCILLGIMMIIYRKKYLYPI